MKHLPFDSVYRQDFEVVEERQGNIRLYPHTDQLPILLRALNHEFYTPLPPKIARVDHRATAFNKIVLNTSALFYTIGVNAHRKDDLRLYKLLTPDLVAKVAIVKQITEHTPIGASHRFKFYAGADFFIEIRMCGKRVAFADHVLQQFSQRVPNKISNDLSELILAFFCDSIVCMRIGHGLAFVTAYNQSILAFTFKEKADEFFVTTCLSVKEIASLEAQILPRAMNLHYAETFNPPRLRNWLPSGEAVEHFESWKRKAPFAEVLPYDKPINWHTIACRIPDFVKMEGHGEGSSIVFQDRIPGPSIFTYTPDLKEVLIDEIQLLKELAPDIDWDALIQEREAELANINQGSI